MDYLENSFLKSLTTFPTYRQAGFTKGRSNLPLGHLLLAEGRERGIEGDFHCSCLHTEVPCFGTQAWVTLRHETLYRECLAQ
jgi:hypothetical protein